MLRLLGAHIGGQLNLKGVQVSNTGGGPALIADNLRTDSDMSLKGATLRGAGQRGVLRLHAAYIGGQLNLSVAKITGDRIIDLDNARSEREIFLPATVLCPDTATMSRQTCPHSSGLLAVDGLRYLELGWISWRQWLHLLTQHTVSYAPQPYQQLAAVERAAGHDANARAILIAQQDDLRRRNPAALGGRTARARHWLWGWLGRYGYRAHRLATMLIVVLLAVGAWGVIGGQIPTRPGHHAIERVTPSGTPATALGVRCSPIELIGLGIDRGLPLAATGVRARCDIDTEPGRGQAVLAVLWILQAMLWALATLAVASYTGLVRKPT